ncbi:MAG: hypothetical protein GX958_11725 [Desulfitobacterium sp.]|nr:hypothetical protein [Desulfitobacterium sp.]
MQYFVKLLLLKSNTPTLLFGYCAPTEQPPYAWKKKLFDKKLPIIQYTAILDKQEKNRLLDILNNRSLLKIDEDELVLNLESRPSVFSDISGLVRNKPVSEFHKIDEYWNLDKAFLMEEIEKSFPSCNGRELRDNIQRFFEVLKRECGIDFSQEGGRLGNFEYYTPGKYMNSFEVKGDIKSIIIQKKHPISEKLIVNCAAENEGRWISNEVKDFSPDIDELVFSANEPMTHYKIKIWEKDSGALVYASENVYMMEVHLNIGMVTSQKVIQDPWTEKLQQNASRHKEDIDKIKNVTVVSRHHGGHVNSGQHVPWRQAKKDGEKLCALYKKVRTKGAFVPKTADRKGEIDSFQKVREYIEAGGVKQVVLSDPYFSVKSAAKLLGRISTTNVELNVITALSTLDPDTGEKNAETKEQCKAFIEQNRNLLHSNLTILNVLRGKKQGFHDRCLIRYFDDGHIDGFLLSNSLNSAGQFFPYIIAPLESEVCLEVADYLQKLTDITYQNTLPEDERVQIETLCSPVTNRENTELGQEYALPQLLTGESSIEDAIRRCVNLNYFTDDSISKNFTVLPEALPEIISVIFQDWNSNPETKLKALGEAFYHTYSHVIDEGKNIIQTIPDAICSFSKTISQLAKDVEERQKHGQMPIYSQQFIYWAVMNGSAEPRSVSYWVKHPGLVYYAGEGYWSSLYNLFLLLTPEEFMHTLESVKSPLMLSILIEDIALRDYDKDLYELLLKSKWNWMHDLGAEWVWRNYESNNLDINDVLDSIEPHMQLKQSAYLLSKAAFHARMQQANTSEGEKEWNLCSQLIERIVRLCNETDIPRDEQITALNKVKELEKNSNAWLILSIAQSIKDESVRNDQLDRIINPYFNSDHSLPCNLKKDGQYIEFVVKAAELRYKDTFEKRISKLLHWHALSDWKEPYLRDRDYDRWSSSEKIVGWDAEFLKTYQNLGYELGGKLKRYLDQVKDSSDK